MSTYSSILRVELVGNGEQSNTWGTTLNTQLGTILEAAIAGRATVTVSDVADTTLSTANGSTDEARCLAINLTGTTTASRNVICPALSKFYVVTNATTGGYSVVFKTSGGTGITLINGISYFLYCDGTNVIQPQASPDNAYFPNVSSTVTATHTELNYVAGVTSQLSGNSQSATLTNKTLTSPTINTGTLNTPTLSSAILGTPQSGTLTNCTGLPISTGVSGLGSNVAAFLATPSSANLASAVTGETGSGALVFASSPTIDTLAVTTSLQLDGVDVALEKMEQNSKSAPYTLVASDAGKHILHPSADTTARTFTIPANSSVAFPIGTVITFVNQVSAGTLSIEITTDTMRLAGPGTLGTRQLAANGIATALKLTSTEWIISGTNLS